MSTEWVITATHLVSFKIRQSLDGLKVKLQSCMVAQDDKNIINLTEVR